MISHRLLIGLWLALAPAVVTAEDAPVFPAQPPALESSVSATVEIKKTQSGVDENQDKAARHLSFSTSSAANITELQNAAKAAQADANRALSEISALQEQMRKLATEAKVFYEYAVTASSSKQKSLKAVTAMETELAQSKEEIASKQAALNDPETTKGQDPNSAKATKRDIEKNIDSLKFQIGQVEGRLNHAQGEIKFFGEGLEKHKATYQSLLQKLQDARASIPAAVTAAQDKQKLALQAQQAALAALLVLPPDPADKSDPTAAGSSDPQASPLTAASQPSAPPSNPLPTSVPALLDEASATENRIADRYREIRASDLALIRGLTLSEARNSTDLPKSDREAIDKETLTTTPNSPGSMDAYNHEMGKALSQVDSMVRFASQLHDAVSSPNSTSGSSTGSVPVSVSGGSASSPSGGSAAAVGRALEKDATDEEGSDAKDLTKMMQAGYKNINPFDDTEAGNLKSEFRPGYVPPGEVPDEKGMMAAAPGRHIAAGLPKAEWLYIDSWNLIGPFPNPDRRNKDRQFPPETVIDLDAVYEGNENKPVRWRFVQTGRPVVTFPEAYTITYAHTELWFDEPRDLWIATGADDAGRLWINGLLVWKAVDSLKPWNISESYRKVSFKKGLNRILFRVENGPGQGWFSLLLRTGAPPSS